MGLSEFITEIRKIPNQISLIRIILIPFLTYSAYKGYLYFFLILFVISGISDAADGWMARKLNQSSKFGAYLDSIADNLMVGFSAFFVYFISPTVFIKISWYCIAAIIFFSIIKTIGLIKYKRIPFYHLFSAKIASALGYLLLLFFVFKRVVWPLYLFLSLVIIVLLEELLVILKFKKIDENIKSFFIR